MNTAAPREIYLDHNATTPIDPEVAETMTACYRMGYGNPASQHTVGRRARQIIEEARQGIAALLGARHGGSAQDRVIFTSGGTEANNLAIRGLPSRPGRLLVSAIEHPSVLAAADYLTQYGFQVEILPVDRGGHVDLHRAAALIDDQTRLVTVMLGNNETGALQPVTELARLCRVANVPMHTDAVQVAGKLPIDFQQLAVDAMSISGHKFHGPQGIGALLLRHDAWLHPLLMGGLQQFGFRPGTEPVALAVGLHRALEIWNRQGVERAARMQALRDRLEALLLASGVRVVVNGSSPRLPHTSSLSFPGLDRQVLQVALDLAGVFCSTGSACASGSSEPSPVLLAMSCDQAIVGGALRISLGATTTAFEIEEAARRIISVATDLTASRTGNV